MWPLLLFTVTLISFCPVQASSADYIRHRPATRFAKTDDSISIQTLNTYLPYYAGYNEHRIAGILKLLKQDGSDITFFQEVWMKRFHINIRETFLPMGLTVIVYDAVAKNTKLSGLVTIVNGKIHKQEMHSFPFGRDFYDSYLYKPLNINKGFGIAYITHPKFPNTPFWAINTHLHHYDQETRLLQMIHYLKWFLNKTILQDPVILAGDFNFEPDSLEFEMIQHIFRFKEPQSHLGLAYSCTFLCKNNVSGIGYILNIFFTNYGKTSDYIFFRSSPRIKLIPKNFRIFPKKYNGVFLSDHYGLKTDIIFKNNPESRQPVSEKELEERIWRFSQTLDKVQSLLSKNFSAEHQFLNSLRDQLKEPDSVLLQHLKQN